MFPNWNWTLIAVSTSFHSVAILSTLFRFWYQWHMGRMWWNDAWAVLAFLADIACLVVTTIEQPIADAPLPRFFVVGNWILSIAYPTLMWATRISILASIVRVSHPEGTLRYIALGIGTSFGLMGTAMLALRIQTCIAYACVMTRGVLISQTVADCIADILLSALPTWFLRNVKLSRERKILISSALSASMVINIVTVIQTVAYFQPVTSGTAIFAHVKAACSMIVCNLLVIVTFFYRMLHKGNTGMEDLISGTRKIEFTTVDLNQVECSQQNSKGTSFFAPSGTTRSSTWSFHGSRSKTSRSTTTASRIDVERAEDRSINVI